MYNYIYIFQRRKNYLHKTTRHVRNESIGGFFFVNYTTIDKTSSSNTYVERVVGEAYEQGELEVDGGAEVDEVV